MIALKKTRLKIKKQVWFILGGLFILIILIMISMRIYNTYQYHQTNEYKLLEKGYTEDEIKLLENNLEDKEINALTNSDKDTFLISVLQDDYFIKENLNRYMNYHKDNEGLTTRECVSIVNTNTDYEYYSKDFDNNTRDDILLLVNKYYHLNKDYTPSDLVDINNKYYYGENHKIRSVAYDAFIDMWNHAYEDGIYLIINSSYRTFLEQQSVYDAYKDSRGTTYADSIAARPGYSEHQTGLSLDIFSKEHTTTANFKNSPAHIWLCDNAYKFGFIQRYEEDTEKLTGFAEEAWHWRYVGVDVATYLHEHDITFDEYYAYFINK